MAGNNCVITYPMCLLTLSLVGSLENLTMSLVRKIVEIGLDIVEEFSDVFLQKIRNSLDGWPIFETAFDYLKKYGFDPAIKYLLSNKEQVITYCQDHVRKYFK